MSCQGTAVALTASLNESTGGRPWLMVGVDFSDTSGCALLEARRLARLLNARVSVIHVVPDPFRVPWEPDERATMWLRTYSASTLDIEPRCGRTWSELARAAEERGAAAIVVGSHGTSGYQPVALGSTATGLSLLAPCPVVLVGPRADEAAQRRRALGYEHAALNP